MYQADSLFWKTVTSVLELHEDCDLLLLDSYGRSLILHHQINKNNKDSCAFRINRIKII